MTALLERVRFLGGTGPEVPPLDTTPGDEPEALDPDPVPGRAARKSTGAAKSATSRKTAASQKRTGGKFTSSAAVQTQMQDELEAYARMIALTWSMSDEHCAGVLNDTAGNIARDIAALAARSEWVVERFTTTTLLADCMKLAHSLLPLLRAVYVHHIAGRADAEPEQEGYDRVTVADDTADINGYAPWRPVVA